MSHVTVTSSIVKYIFCCNILYLYLILILTLIGQVQYGQDSNLEFVVSYLDDDDEGWVRYIPQDIQGAHDNRVGATEYFLEAALAGQQHAALSNR